MKALAGGDRRPAMAREMATATGRSKPLPSLRSSAGARLTVSRWGGKGSRLFRIAERTRSRAFLDAGVAETDQVEAWGAGRNVDLHLHDLPPEPAEHAAEN